MYGDAGSIQVFSERNAVEITQTATLQPPRERSIIEHREFDCCDQARVVISHQASSESLDGAILHCMGKKLLYNFTLPQLFSTSSETLPVELKESCAETALVRLCSYTR